MQYFQFFYMNYYNVFIFSESFLFILMCLDLSVIMQSCCLNSLYLFDKKIKTQYWSCGIIILLWKPSKEINQNYIIPTCRLTDASSWPFHFVESLTTYIRKTLQIMTFWIARAHNIVNNIPFSCIEFSQNL